MTLTTAIVLAWTFPLMFMAGVYIARRRDEQRRREQRNRDFKIIRRIQARNRRRDGH